MIKIEISDHEDRATAIAEKFERAVKIVLSEAGIASADISVAVVDDATIWKLNREFLDHDYPTDVLSFLLSHEAERLEGEIIVSADTASREAAQHEWPADSELLLYVVHGALHLVGHEDGTPVQRQQMQDREKQVLSLLEISVPDFHAESFSTANEEAQA